MRPSASGTAPGRSTYGQTNSGIARFYEYPKSALCICDTNVHQFNFWPWVAGVSVSREGASLRRDCVICVVETDLTKPFFGPTLARSGLAASLLRSRRRSGADTANGHLLMNCSKRHRPGSVFLDVHEFGAHPRGCDLEHGTVVSRSMKRCERM